jgi:hypothetical protein
MSLGESLVSWLDDWENDASEPAEWNRGCLVKPCGLVPLPKNDMCMFHEAYYRPKCRGCGKELRFARVYQNKDDIPTGICATCRKKRKELTRRLRLKRLRRLIKLRREELRKQKFAI